MAWGMIGLARATCVRYVRTICVRPPERVSVRGTRELGRRRVGRVTGVSSGPELSPKGMTRLKASLYRGGVGSGLCSPDRRSSKVEGWKGSHSCAEIAFTNGSVVRSGLLAGGRVGGLCSERRRRLELTFWKPCRQDCGIECHSSGRGLAIRSNIGQLIVDSRDTVANVPIGCVPWHSAALSRTAASGQL